MPDSRPRVEWAGVALDLAVAGGALAVLVVSLLFAPGSLPDLPLCNFREWTGLPCIGCGMTRAFCAIGHGKFSSAWEYNPLGFLFYAAAVALLFLPLARRKWPGIGKRFASTPWFLRLAILSIAVMWVFGVARMLGALVGR